MEGFYIEGEILWPGGSRVRLHAGTGNGRINGELVCRQLELRGNRIAIEDGSKIYVRTNNFTILTQNFTIQRGALLSTDWIGNTTNIPINLTIEGEIHASRVEFSSGLNRLTLMSTGSIMAPNLSITGERLYIMGVIRSNGSVNLRARRYGEISGQVISRQDIILSRFNVLK